MTGHTQTLPLALYLLLMLGTVAGVLWVFTEVGRRYAVRGSRPRYIFAGVERALRYPTGFWLAMSAATNLHFSDWLDMGFNLLSFALWLTVLWEKRRDGNDDDFWSDLSKRIRSLLGPQADTGHL